MIFRSKRSVGVENEMKRDSEGQKGWAHAAKESSHVGPLLLGLGSSFFPIFLSHTLISIKIDFYKFIRNSEKLSNTKVTFY